MSREDVHLVSFKADRYFVAVAWPPEFRPDSRILTMGALSIGQSGRSILLEHFRQRRWPRSTVVNYLHF